MWEACEGCVSQDWYFHFRHLVKVKQVHRKVNQWKLSRVNLPFVITISFTLCSCSINLVFSKPMKNKASQNNFYCCSLLSPHPVQCLLLLKERKCYYFLMPGSDVEPNLNYGLPKLFRPAELIQTPVLIAAELSSKSKKCSFGSNCLRNNYVIIIYGLGSVHEMFGV